MLCARTPCCTRARACAAGAQPRVVCAHALARPGANCAPRTRARAAQPRAVRAVRAHARACARPSARPRDRARARALRTLRAARATRAGNALHTCLCTQALCTPRRARARALREPSRHRVHQERAVPADQPSVMPIMPPDCVVPPIRSLGGSHESSLESGLGGSRRPNWWPEIAKPVARPPLPDRTPTLAGSAAPFGAVFGTLFR